MGCCVSFVSKNCSIFTNISQKFITNYLKIGVVVCDTTKHYKKQEKSTESKFLQKMIDLNQGLFYNYKRN